MQCVTYEACATSVTAMIWSRFAGVNVWKYKWDEMSVSDPTRWKNLILRTP